MIDSILGYSIIVPYSDSGESYICRTTTGGTSWLIQYTSPSASSLLAMHFANKNVGVITSPDGIIHRTNTGGVLTFNILLFYFPSASD